MRYRPSRGPTLQEVRRADAHPSMNESSRSISVPYAVGDKGLSVGAGVAAGSRGDCVGTRVGDAGAGEGSGDWVGTTGTVATGAGEGALVGATVAIP